MKKTYIEIRNALYQVIDPESTVNKTKPELNSDINEVIDQLCVRLDLNLSKNEQVIIIEDLVNEILGYGPIDRLMSDESIADIMVNGAENVYVERNGVVEKSNIEFVDEKQLIDIAKRIASKVGRNVDESAPLCDARLKDGSRVNIVIPPVSLDGTSVSIRKFKEQKLGLKDLVGFNAMPPEIAKILILAARCRLNIVVSGGTGSGKTTMLCALSEHINDNERIVTIEDAAELTLHKAHVVRLETKKSNSEGSTPVTQRDLVINSLRMRPERIIVGECRGEEAFEMLQAMNTGHDGSMTTLHANTPRDAISRIESMVMMGVASLPLPAIRNSIVSAVDMIIQVNRLNDGSRKVTNVVEVVGLEENKVVMQDIARFVPERYRQGIPISEYYEINKVLQRSKLYKKIESEGYLSQFKSIFGEEEL